MYVPKQFEEKRVDVMHDLIRAHALATLITVCDGVPNANHIPMHLAATPEPFGTLYGHVARANPILEDWQDGGETLAVFHGPNTYITPSWYATKKETGKVAPTWNYAVVHAYGAVRVVDDPDWLRGKLEALTADHETRFREPWLVSDAPEDFTEKLMEKIIGFEMPITRLIGKWKVSQNQPLENQEGVIAGLTRSGGADARVIASLVEGWAKRPEEED